tara:strand:- start:133 stop:534 length:402 start_codon:yes stop_codon:yes gene_type:complete
MKNIFSKRDNILLHCIHFKNDFESRINITEESEPLQISSMTLNKNNSFKPHYHKKSKKNNNSTQECWIIIEGKIEATYYDIDNTIIETCILNAGDCSITLCGAHVLKPLTDETKLYEIKNGPYLGRDNEIEYI